MNKTMKLLTVMVFLFSLFGSGFQASVAAAGEKTVTVTVVRDDTNVTVQDEIEVQLGENATALDALKAAVGVENVDLEDSTWGPFIFGIKDAKGHDGFSWAFYVDSFSAPVGADTYLVKDGEKLTFALQEWNLENEVSLKVIGKNNTVMNETAWPNQIYGEPTALEYLQFIAGTENVVTSVHQTWGILIDSINGLPNDENGYWSFLVNGEWAPSGAGDYHLKYGDDITFQYVSTEPTTETPGDGDSDSGSGEVVPTQSIAPATIQNAIDGAISQIPADSIGDWEVIALSQAGKSIPANYLEKVTNTIKEANGSFRKITEYERYTLSILAVGGDPTNVAGYNLVSSIYNFNGDADKQGANAMAFGLIALDSRNYPVPSTAKWTREKFIQNLIDTQQSDGRWTGLSSDIDLTAMALIALAPYKNQASVNDTINKGLDYLENQYDTGKVDTSDAMSQVIIALTSLGIDPSGTEFSKDGVSILSNLLTFQTAEKGFAWKVGGETNAVSTSQAMQALVAYQLFSNGKGFLYSLPIKGQISAVNEQSINSQQNTKSSIIQTGKKLPNTATNNFNSLAIGLFILLAGMVSFYFGQRKKA